MHKLLKSILLLAPVLLLASCGIGVDQLVKNGVDNSPNWNDNYYYHFDDEFKNANQGINRTLNVDSDKLFTSYKDDNFKAFEPDYVEEKYYTSETEQGYGYNRKLSNTLEEAKEGFMSKLFDGKLFCRGRYEKVRIQIDETGLSRKFNYKCGSANYFAVQFKSALDFKTSTSVYPHYANITYNFNFYTKENNSYIKNTYSYTMKTLTNGYELYDTYYLLGFSFEQLGVTDMIGFSIDYKLNSDEYINETHKNIKHALLLYEVIIANPTWVR